MSIDLEVKVTADLKPLEKALAEIQASLAKTGVASEKTEAAFIGIKPAVDTATKAFKDLGTTTKSVDLNPVQTGLAKTAIAAAKFDSALDKSRAVSNKAGQALTNLGRIAQDAPFGFIGIANNINPLLESFQRLQQESGSTKLALKALGSSLLGAGGLGFAFSAFQFFALGGADSITKFFSAAGNSEKLKEAKKEIDDFNKSLKETEAQGLATGLKLQSFVALAKDQTLSLAQRNDALTQANKILGEHGEKLTLVNVATAAVTEEINKFTNATIQQALANKFADRAADLIIKQREATKAYTAALNNRNAAQLKLNNTNNSSNDAELGGSSVISDLTTVNKAGKGLLDAANTYKLVTKELRSTIGDFATAQLTATSLFGDLGTKAKDIKEVKIKPKKVIFEKPDEIELRFKAPSAVLKILDPIGTAIEDKFKGLRIALPPVNLVELELAKARILEFNTNVTALLQNTAASLFTGFGELLGGALAGQTDIFGAFFGNLLGSLGDGLKQLGIQTIKASKLIIAIRATLGTSGGLAAGIGLVALGVLIKSLASKTKAPAFASGGFVSGSGSSTSDSINARLSNGEYVLQASAVNKFGVGFLNSLNSGFLPRGAGQANISSIPSSQGILVPQITLRGADLVVAFNRANQTINRQS